MWFWEAMCLSLKVAVGGFFWAIIILAIMLGISYFIYLLQNKPKHNFNWDEINRKK